MGRAGGDPGPGQVAAQDGAGGDMPLAGGRMGRLATRGPVGWDVALR
jgi:hypothetical protein